MLNLNRHFLGDFGSSVRGAVSPPYVWSAVIVFIVHGILFEGLIVLVLGTMVWTISLKISRAI